MYDCTVCQSINHDARLHCQNCGTIPAKYSITGKASIVSAVGSTRSGQYRQTRVASFKTVTADYYASGE